MYTPNFIEIGKLFLDGRTNVPTDTRTFPPLMLLSRLRGVDLKTKWRFGRLVWCLACKRTRPMLTTPTHAWADSPKIDWVKVLHPTRNKI